MKSITEARCSAGWRLVMVYLEITLQVAEKNRAAAAGVYSRYKAPFLSQIKGANIKNRLVRAEAVQVLHGFDTEENAKAYLGSPLFAQDVVGELKPFLRGTPDIRIYEVA